MTEAHSKLSETEEELRERFLSGESSLQRVPSTARAARTSERVDQVTLPMEMRPKMPHTKEKYVVRENPHLVEWEREVRLFLRQLSPDHGHRVTAVMVFEWATGLSVKELVSSNEPGLPGRPTWRADLRKINRVLEWYFGKPYATFIMGRKVDRAYKVKPGYYITRHRPMTLTLYAEYVDGVLRP